MRRFFTAVLLTAILSATLLAQSVCLPAPRLLTTMPMGGTQGARFDLTISGEFIEEARELVFSHPSITAQLKTHESGAPIDKTYVVTIADDCPVGIHEVRVMTRLGLSSSKIFTVGNLPELSQPKPTASLELAQALELNSICNAIMPVRAANHYRFQAKAGQRVVIDCAAKGIDSKLKPVLILGDDTGRDLRVQRRGGVIDYRIPADGDYTIKVHDLTFQGGPHHYYRLALRAVEPNATVPRLPSSALVSSHSWPPPGLAVQAASSESEPNDLAAEAEKINLPCDISGSFYPAADVDYYEFQARKGEVWWVEVASERLGRPTDPNVVVQRVEFKDGQKTLHDVTELSDIASPVKVSSYGYSYDGPPYNAGSSDVLGKIEIAKDGVYHLQVSDLLGGTRRDPANVYRLLIRKAQPDFAIVGWGLHMQLRNGDRNALSKPVALRAGATVALEVVVVRRDGFTGPIHLQLENLPDGVTAAGLQIPAGQNRGILLVSAAEGAPRGHRMSKFTGTAEINGKTVTREGRLASMAWPCRNSRDELTSPRLLQCIPVSVGSGESAPISIAAKHDRVYEATVGSKLSIPLLHMRREEFSGNVISLKTFGAGFDRNKPFDVPLTKDASEAVLDLAALKVKPGDYKVAFYGAGVVKYSHYPQGVDLARKRQAASEKLAKDVSAEVSRLTQELNAAAEQAKPKLQQRLLETKKRHADVANQLARSKRDVQNAVRLSQRKDIADIVVSEPIAIRVLPTEKK